MVEPSARENIWYGTVDSKSSHDVDWEPVVRVNCDAEQAIIGIYEPQGGGGINEVSNVERVILMWIHLRIIGMVVISNNIE